jgi:hypothetical protein
VLQILGQIDSRHPALAELAYELVTIGERGLEAFERGNVVRHVLQTSWGAGGPARAGAGSRCVSGSGKGKKTTTWKLCANGVPDQVMVA